MSRNKVIMLWVAAFLVMAVIVIYQRVTGPTYPKTAKIELNNNSYKFSLPTTHGGEGDEKISLNIPDQTIQGKIKYRRFKSNDEWQTEPMVRNGNAIETSLPHQPPAGKIIYQIILESNSKEYSLTEAPVIIRFRSEVPMIIVILHLFFLFGSITLCLRTGLEAIYKGDKVLILSFLTVIFLFVGGIIVGPLMQKFAFGEFWTGWPMKGLLNFGDMTDNKTLIAFLVWLVALWRIKVNPQQTVWVIVAMIVMLAAFLIPHSILGSEIDYTKMPR
jgi:hypothetical protein